MKSCCRLLVARGGEEVDLRREVGASVLLREHVHRGHLRVPGDRAHRRETDLLLLLLYCRNKLSLWSETSRGGHGHNKGHTRRCQENSTQKLRYKGVQRANLSTRAGPLTARLHTRAHVCCSCSCVACTNRRAKDKISVCARTRPRDEVNQEVCTNGND